MLCISLEVSGRCLGLALTSAAAIQFVAVIAAYITTIIILATGKRTLIAHKIRILALSKQQRLHGQSVHIRHQSNECVDTLGRYHGSAYFTCSEPPSPPSTDLHTLGVEIEIEVSAAPASKQASMPIPSHSTTLLPSFSPLQDFELSTEVGVTTGQTMMDSNCLSDYAPYTYTGVPGESVEVSYNFSLYPGTRNATTSGFVGSTLFETSKPTGCYWFLRLHPCDTLNLGICTQIATRCRHRCIWWEYSDNGSITPPLRPCATMAWP